MPLYVKRYISDDVDTQAVSNVYKYAPTDRKAAMAKGELYALITVSKTPEGYASTALKFVWEAILETYSASNSASTTEDVKRSITAGSKKLLELLKNDRKVQEEGIDLSFGIVAVKNATAYLGVFGEQEVFVNKGENFVNISEILNKNRVVAGSFALGQNDKVIISSQGLFSSFVGKITGEEWTGRLEKLSDHLSPGEGLLILSRAQFYEEEPEVEEVAAPVEQVISTPQEAEVEEVKADEVASEIAVSSDPIEKKPVLRIGRISMPKFDKEKWEAFRVKVVDIWGKVRNILLKVWNAILLIVSPVGKFVQRLFDRLGQVLWRLFDDKYGRKLWYKRIKAKLSAMKLTGGQSAYGMKIDGYRESGVRGKRFGIIILLVLLVVVVLGGVKLSIQAKEARELSKTANAVFSTVDSLVKQAESSLPADVESAENYLFQSNEELKKLAGKELSVTDGKKLNEIKSQLSEIDDKVSKRIWVSEKDGSIETFMSTRIALGSESKPSDITTDKDEFQNEFLYVVDNGLKAVYKINLFDKKVTKLPDKDGVLQSPRFVDIGAKGVYVYDDVAGVVRSQFDNNRNNKDFQSLTGLGADDLGVGTVAEFAVFTQNDNIYLLSQSEKAIYKATFTGGGYSLPFVYISSDTFVGSQDFFGDLAIYVLTTGLERFSYNYGTGKVDKSPVTVSGPIPEVESPIAGYTGATLDNLLYVFESGEKNRMLVFEKPKEGGGDLRHPNEMVLINEYQYRGDQKEAFKNVADLVVDSQENQAYILDGTVVWKVNIN
ncbi:MAG: hypothetical protein UT34_C0001G0484 [candidate division WS6 bacterium GW2011_GWF2_39_15]|uniref:Uncharacterized protein n=1 Tax=candidate division WS6 bacterium GW2011_GWF2_39_15 TaxID=1619100 RepID=A0A0G0MTE8_9BACT|nr:MAG: hypothetical protein UT34_C0001G0484 [candidate division WS6 bacterium GW2011_GWF2_39_15]